MAQGNSGTVHPNGLPTYRQAAGIDKPYTVDRGLAAVTNSFTSIELTMKHFRAESATQRTGLFRARHAAQPKLDAIRCEPKAVRPLQSTGHHGTLAPPTTHLDFEGS